MDTTEFVQSYLEELRACLDQVSPDQVQQVVRLLREAMEQQRVVYVLGNGGSAATASHVASDLSRARAGSGKPGLRAECLTDNIAAFTATANDTGFEGAFAEMLALRSSPSAARGTLPTCCAPWSRRDARAPPRWRWWASAAGPWPGAWTWPSACRAAITARWKTCTWPWGTCCP